MESFNLCRSFSSSLALRHSFIEEHMNCTCRWTLSRCMCTRYVYLIPYARACQRFVDTFYRFFRLGSDFAVFAHFSLIARNLFLNSVFFFSSYFIFLCNFLCVSAWIPLHLQHSTILICFARYFSGGTIYHRIAMGWVSNAVNRLRMYRRSIVNTCVW